MLVAQLITSFPEIVKVLVQFAEEIMNFDEIVSALAINLALHVLAALMTKLIDQAV